MRTRRPTLETLAGALLALCLASPAGAGSRGLGDGLPIEDRLTVLSHQAGGFADAAQETGGERVLVLDHAEGLERAPEAGRPDWSPSRLRPTGPYTDLTIREDSAPGRLTRIRLKPAETPKGPVIYLQNQARALEVARAAAQVLPNDYRFMDTTTSGKVLVQMKDGKITKICSGIRPGAKIHFANGTTATRLANSESGRPLYKVDTGEGAAYQAVGSPLTFDLDGNGVRTGKKKVLYDINGDGRLDVLDDISQGDALLVFDADGDGVSGEDGRELLGDNTDLDGDGKKDGYRDGFEALLALARKAVREGILPRSALEDLTLQDSEILLLEEACGLRMKMGGLRGDALTLYGAGVESIVLSDKRSRREKDFDGRGNDVSRREGARFKKRGGSESSYEDIWFRYDTPDPAAPSS